MKVRLFSLRCAAFFLILVFSQKAGAGLLLHNLLHNTAANDKAQGQQENEKSKEFTYNCTCIDDFLVPFDGTDAPVFSQPVLTFAIPYTFFEDNIPFHTPIFSSLRGPPVFIM